MFHGTMNALRRTVLGSLERRINRIEDGVDKMESAINHRRPDLLYKNLAVTTRQIEAMSKELRETMTEFHSDLQMLELLAPSQQYPLATEVDISLENGCFSVKMPAMLPFPSAGPVHFLHGLLDKALDAFVAEHDLPRPYYRERVAVIFIHHYDAEKGDIRHLRDYDNLEHRCVTNVHAVHMLWSDSPKYMISMDVLAPGDTNFTEVRIMTISAFRDFVMSEKLTFNP